MVTIKRIQKIINKSSVTLLFIALSACAADHEVRQQQEPQQRASNLVPPSLDKAIGMIVPHDSQTVYSLYGIELGESKSSVEEKYHLVGCRKDIFYIRCAVLLDTSGVTGVSVSDKTTVFIVFENDHVREMSVPIFPAALQQSQLMLNRIYGIPANTVDKRSVWSNLSGSILLEENTNKTKPSVIKYSIE